MTWSLGEIEALARKAARGAGFPWGLADEAGRATRMAAGYGWPGPQALADWLGTLDGADLTQHRPVSLNTDHWAASSGSLCPIITGAALSDLARRWADGALLTLGPIAYPLLLVPFMAQASTTTSTALALRFPGLTLWHEADGLRLSGDPVLLAHPSVPSAQLCADHAPPETIVITSVTRAAPPPDTIATLTRLAARTYAPDTEASRLSGAGAGLNDND